MGVLEAACASMEDRAHPRARTVRTLKLIAAMSLEMSQ